MPIKYLREISATWRTPFSGELWDKLKRLGKADADIPDYWTFGPTLPSEDESRIATAFVHRCKDDELHWTMVVRPAPKGEAPDSVREGAQKFGGRSGLISLLCEALPVGMADIGAFRVRLLLPGDAYTCPTLPSAVDKSLGHDAALRLGRSVSLEQVGYRFEGGAGGIEEITLVYLHAKKEYAVTVSASGPLKFDSKVWLPFADDVGAIAKRAFFSRKEIGEE